MAKESTPGGGGGGGGSKRVKKREGEGEGERASVSERGRGQGPVPSGLPPHLEEQRGRVQCDMDAPKNTSTVQYGGAYSSLGDRASATVWNMEGFKRDFDVQVQWIKGDDMEFDLINIDPAIANAFRRILLSEVPSMAIEKVFISDNTSLIQDEVLAHRLGLVPLRLDPRHFEFLQADGLANENNTVVFKLSQRCKKVGNVVHGAKVLSSMLEWMPGGSTYPPDQPQKKFTTFTDSQANLHDFATSPPAPTYPDIVLAKMRPSQVIELEAHAVKGIGRTHAKWSPVATASYRMLPEVKLKEAIEGSDAEELVKLCPMKVFDIEDAAGEKKATVARPRACTLCRECIRKDSWAQRVQLTRVKTHFIFTVEGTGSLPPSLLFTEAVNILKAKASKLLNELQ